MANLTIQEKLDIYRELHEHITWVAEEVFDIRNFAQPDGFNVHQIDVYEKRIEVEYIVYSRGGCCERDDYYFEEFPVSYLWEEGWAEKERKARLKRNLDAMAKKEKEEKEKADKEKLSRLKKYLTLKEEISPVIEELLAGSKPLDPEFAKIVDSEFWELLQKSHDLNSEQVKSIAPVLAQSILHQAEKEREES